MGGGGCVLLWEGGREGGTDPGSCRLISTHKDSCRQPRVRCPVVTNTVGNNNMDVGRMVVVGGGEREM